MTVFDRSSLPNGVRVIAAPMAHVQSTACYVKLAAGSRYESAETHGVAHFVEHMLFCGTPRRPSVRALAGEVDAIGGLFNAGTNKEWTQYYVKCASDYAPQAIDVLADMLRNSLFEESEVEREKKVIIEEIRAKFDTPRDYVDENLELLMYGDTPLGRFKIGSEDTVRATTRETLVGFMQRLYEPTRMIVGLSGKLSSDVFNAVESHLADIENGSNGAGELPGPAPDGERIILDTKPIDQAHVCLGVRAYPSSHPDRYAVQLIATILGGGMSSRLTEELTMRQGLAYSVFAVSHGHTDAGGLWAQGGVNVDKVDEAIAAMRTELERLGEDAVGDAELDKARNFAKGRFAFSIETPQGLITHALRGEILHGAAREPDEVLGALDAVTAADIQRVAQDLLSGGFYLSLIGPFDDRERFAQLIG